MTVEHYFQIAAFSGPYRLFRPVRHCTTAAGYRALDQQVLAAGIRELERVLHLFSLLDLPEIMHSLFEGHFRHAPGSIARRTVAGRSFLAVFGCLCVTGACHQGSADKDIEQSFHMLFGLDAERLVSNASCSPIVPRSACSIRV